MCDVTVCVVMRGTIAMHRIRMRIDVPIAEIIGMIRMIVGMSVTIICMILWRIVVKICIGMYVIMIRVGIVCMR